jgi:hypothetical protein
MKPSSEIWVAFIDSLTWKKGHLDESSWYAFLRAGSLDIGPQEAMIEVARRIEEAGDHPKTGKLQRQIRRAFSFAGAHAGEVYVPKEPKPVYQPDKLNHLAKKIDFDVVPWLAKVSPLSTWNRLPAGFLHVLYRPGERVIVFDIFESQGCEVWTHGARDLCSLNYLQRGKFGVWFLANPVDGQYHWNPREQKQSRRSEEAITSWRYWVIESDKAPKDLWLKALIQLPLPIVAIYDSGGDSIHALVRVNARSKEEWDRIVRVESGPLIVPLGADFSAMTAVRLTRLPNCRREQTGKRQSLLYLNPVADCTPIVERKVRRA